MCDNVTKFDIGSATIEETRSFITGMGEPAYRADQVYQWVHRRHAADFDAMTNLPKPLRQRLAEAAFFPSPVIRGKKNDADGTIKVKTSLTNVDDSEKDVEVAE